MILDHRRTATVTTWAAIANAVVAASKAPLAPQRRGRYNTSVSMATVRKAARLWNEQDLTAREIAQRLGWQGDPQALMGIVRYRLGPKTLKPHPIRGPKRNAAPVDTGPVTMKSLGRYYLRKIGVGPSLEYVFRVEGGGEEVWVRTDDLGGIKFRGGRGGGAKDIRLQFKERLGVAR